MEPAEGLGPGGEAGGLLWAAAGRDSATLPLDKFFRSLGPLGGGRSQSTGGFEVAETEVAGPNRLAETYPGNSSIRRRLMSGALKKPNSSWA